MEFEENEILVSVWMTTYNHESYISDAIEGVINQKTNFSWELIIGEDSSTDKTREICLKYKNKYPGKIKLILNTQNIGLIANYNTTLQKCKGKYVAYCDGDDYWPDPFKLQKQVDFLELNKSFELVYTDKNVQSGMKIYYSEGKILFADISFETIVLSNMICPSTVLIKAEIAKKYSSSVTETATIRNWLTFDYPLWLEISMDHKIGFIPDATCVYRFVPDSSSHHYDTLKSYRWDKCLLDIQLYYYKKYITHNKNRNKRFRNKFKEMVFHSRKQMILKYGWVAKRDLIDILKMNPIFYFYLIYSKCLRSFKELRLFSIA
jgi:glycosyltransferase involved in cell wall biosynthesis